MFGMCELKRKGEEMMSDTYTEYQWQPHVHK